MATPGAIIEEEAEQAEAPAARPSGAKPGAARPAGRTLSAQHLHRYFDILGLKHGATLEAINTAYYSRLKVFPEKPTEEQEVRIQEIKRAYDVLKRAYVPPATRRKKVVLDRRMLIPVFSIMIVVALGVLVALNWGAIKLSMTHYEPGAVLKLKGQSQPYGEVTGFDPRHKWDVGNPSPAYSIRLQGSQDVVWVGERLVVNGMVPVK